MLLHQYYWITQNLRKPLANTNLHGPASDSKDNYTVGVFHTISIPQFCYQPIQTKDCQ